MEMTDKPLIVQDKEYIKLYKMSKGYNWEIKLFADNGAGELLDRVEELNKEMKERFEKGSIDDDE